MTNQQWGILGFIALAILAIIIGIIISKSMAKKQRKSSINDYDEPVEQKPDTSKEKQEDYQPVKQEDNEFVTFLQNARITTSDGINRTFHFQQNGFIYLQEEGKKTIEAFSFQEILEASWENEKFKFILEKHNSENFILITNDINNTPISVQLISLKGKKIL